MFGFGSDERAENNEVRQMAGGTRQLINAFQSSSDDLPPGRRTEMLDYFVQSRSVNTERQVAVFVELRPSFHGSGSRLFNWPQSGAKAYSSDLTPPSPTKLRARVGGRYLRARRARAEVFATGLWTRRLRFGIAGRAGRQRRT